MANELMKFRRSGQYTGNGTSQEIVCGFKPSAVHIYNWTKDGSEVVHKLPGMENDTAVIDKNSKGKILSEAVTITNIGFTVGSSQYVNLSGETFLWEVVE